MTKGLLSLSFAICLALLAAAGGRPVFSAEEQFGPKGAAIVNPQVLEQVITVGGPNADIAPFTSAAIQIAVDALKARGGGMVKLLSGTFDIKSPVRLANGISLTGSGETTILHKVNGYKSPFAVSADYGMLNVTVQDAKGFEPGMGVSIYDPQGPGNWFVTTAVITRIEANTLYIDNYLVTDYSPEHKGYVSNSCSIIEAVEAENVKIADLTIDGNRNTNDRVGGCRSGGIYLHKARNCAVENVEVKNFNGDGISWQITEQITVRNCRVHHCANFGLHPGTGSVQTTIEGCTVNNNGSDGLFLCWRVQHGAFRDNKIYSNGQYGISIGHKDTDNVFTGNHIYENAAHGVYFREENEENAGHRNTFTNNIVENNGQKAPSFGFCIDGPVRDIIIRDNIIRDTGEGRQKGPFQISKSASNIKTTDNDIGGHVEP